MNNEIYQGVAVINPNYFLEFLELAILSIDGELLSSARRDRSTATYNLADGDNARR
jgi:hypothetical protein